MLSCSALVVKLYESVITVRASITITLWCRMEQLLSSSASSLSCLKRLKSVLCRIAEDCCCFCFCGSVYSTFRLVCSFSVTYRLRSDQPLVTILLPITQTQPAAAPARSAWHRASAACRSPGSARSHSTRWRSSAGRCHGTAARHSARRPEVRTSARHPVPCRTAESPDSPHCRLPASAAADSAPLRCPTLGESAIPRCQSAARLAARRRESVALC